MNKQRTLLLFILAVGMSLVTAAQKTNGVNLTAADMNINVTFYSPDIVRVTKVPVGCKTTDKKSEVVTMSPQSALPAAVQFAVLHSAETIDGLILVELVGH